MNVGIRMQSDFIEREGQELRAPSATGSKRADWPGCKSRLQMSLKDNEASRLVSAKSSP